MTEKLEIRLKKSLITEPGRTRRTVESLGLKKMQQVVVHTVNSALLGKLDKIRHLVEIREV